MRGCAVDAADAGLVHTDTDAPGITRRASARGFRYFGIDGKCITDPATLLRIRRIAVPPAWTGVWISPKANSHIQAVGRDARRRKQYRYHPDFRSMRDANKFGRLAAFAACLPKLRRKIAADMRARTLSHDKVVATLVHLLDRTLMRIGNADYAAKNGSFGLSTLRDRHARIDGTRLRFTFVGKGGKQWEVTLANTRAARIVKACRELPGQHLFQYAGPGGEPVAVTSTDVNAYLRAETGTDITAKDFRTWGGTLLAVRALAELPPPDSETTARGNIKEAVEAVAAGLGNTPAICRKCYIHPAIFEAYATGRLDPERLSRASAPQFERSVRKLLTQAHTSRPLKL